ncbi:MAG: diacylglycerol kinase family protein [Clostridia bacterium]
MRYVFVVNPNAGVKNIYEDVENKINRHFANSEIEYKICQSIEKGDITYICRCEAETGDEVRIYCFGGDGTLWEAVNGIVGFDNVELGVFPSGSGNDYIKTFGQRKDFLDFAAQMDGESIEVDLIKTDNGISINNVCLGFDAKIAIGMTKFKKLPLVGGSRAYDLSLANSLLTRIGDDFDITLQTKDGKENFSGRFLFATASIGQYYGGSFNVAPLAKVDDGLIDFVLIKKPPLVKIPGLVNLYKNGEHINDAKFEPYLIYRQGYSMEITSKNEVYCVQDGEGQKVKKESIVLSPYKIKFILPKGIEFLKK